MSLLLDLKIIIRTALKVFQDGSALGEPLVAPSRHFARGCTVWPCSDLRPKAEAT